MNLFEQQGKITQLFTQTPVAAAYASGSLVEHRPLGSITDVDIGLLLLERISADQFLSYRMYFLGELMRLLESERIDVVILNQVSLLLQFRIVAKGQLLFNRDEKRRIDFETRLLMDYLDFQRFADLQQQALTSRMPGRALLYDTDEIAAALDRVAEQITFAGAARRDGADQVARLACERALQLAVEWSFEVAIRVIATLGLRRPEELHDVFSIMAAAGVIPRELAYRLERVADLRNALVRGFDVVADLMPALTALEAFIGAIRTGFGTES